MLLPCFYKCSVCKGANVKRLGHISFIFSLSTLARFLVTRTRSLEVYMLQTPYLCVSFSAGRQSAFRVSVGDEAGDDCLYEHGSGRREGFHTTAARDLRDCVLTDQSHAW